MQTVLMRKPTQKMFFRGNIALRHSSVFYSVFSVENEKYPFQALAFINNAIYHHSSYIFLFSFPLAGPDNVFLKKNVPRPLYAFHLISRNLNLFANFHIMSFVSPVILPRSL